MKKAIGIILLAVALLSVLCTFASCYRVPDEDRKLPSENCVMVYTISDKESIRILYNPDSDYHLYGEWIKDQTTTPVHLDADNIPSTFSCSDGGYVVSIKTFDPDEKDATYASEKDWICNKGVLNSSEIRNAATGETIPVTYSCESGGEYHPSWVSDVLLSFAESDGKIYEEKALHFWYDFEAKKGEWAAKDLTIPIRMQFSGISPSDVNLRIYDISGEGEKEILCARGNLTDQNTYVAKEVSGSMFYKGTISEITIVKTAR